MAEMILKVTPEEVKDTATKISTQAELMRGIMGELKTKVVQLEEYWKSTSGTSYIEQYENVNKNIQKSLDALMNHINNLTEAATRYEQSETDITSGTQALSGENIF